MPSESGSDVKFEIGHVLFIDIVGYSKLLIHEQSEQLQKLREIVRATEQFRAAKRKVTYCGYQPATAAHLFFVQLQKHRSPVRWKSAAH